MDFVRPWLRTVNKYKEVLFKVGPRTVERTKSFISAIDDALCYAMLRKSPCMC